jgi:uncharacterized protein YjaG (DUF416 family)
MGDWAFLPEGVRAELRGLSEQHLVAFAASICERLLPNYVAWSTLVGWGDPAPLRRGLDRLWEGLAGADVPTEEVRALIDAAGAMAPDSEDFPDSAAALDAAAAICEALEACLGNTLEHAASVATSAGDTIDAAFELIPTELAASAAAELEKQQRDITWLRAAPRLTPALVAEVRRNAREGGGATIARAAA